MNTPYLECGFCGRASNSECEECAEPQAPSAMVVVKDLTERKIFIGSGEDGHLYINDSLYSKDNKEIVYG